MTNIRSSSKRQELKKGGFPEPILPINSGLHRSSDEESESENGSADSVSSLKSDAEKGNSIHATVEDNHADEKTEKSDDIQTIEVTRYKNKPAKKKEENVHATIDIEHDDGQSLNTLTVPEVAKALVWISF